MKERIILYFKVVFDLTCFMQVSAQNRPNIVMCLADDQKQAYGAVYGAEGIRKTTHEKLFAAGISGDNTIVDLPACQTKYMWNRAIQTFLVSHFDILRRKNSNGNWDLLDQTVGKDIRLNVIMQKYFVRFAKNKFLLKSDPHEQIIQMHKLCDL